MLSKVFYLGLHNLVNLLTKLAEEDYYAVVIAGDRAPKIARLLATSKKSYRVYRVSLGLFSVRRSGVRWCT